MAMHRIKVKKRARILSKAEFKRMLKVVTITREAIRNQLILCFSFACGLRVTELASITIRDIMFASGRLKNELTLRADITKNAHVRTVPMSSKLLIDCLERYLEYRIENNIGVIPAPTGEEFRNLSPDMPVIFSNRGSGFVLATKKRVLQDGSTEEYKASDALEQLFRDLYSMGGYTGASSHSGRRSYATHLIQGGADIEDVSHLLGHGSIDFTMVYLEPSKDSIKEAFEVALTLDPNIDYEAEKYVYEPPAGEATSAAKEPVESKWLADFNKQASKLISGMAQGKMADKLSKLISLKTIEIHPAEPVEVSPELMKPWEGGASANEILEAIKPFEVKAVSGVYFLLNNENDVVYVGQSKNVLSRIGAHCSDKEKRPHFSKVSVLPVPHEHLITIEEKFIKALSPILNKKMPS